MAALDERGERSRLGVGHGQEVGQDQELALAGRLVEVEIVQVLDAGGDAQFGQGFVEAAGRLDVGVAAAAGRVGVVVVALHGHGFEAQQNRDGRVDRRGMGEEVGFALDDVSDAADGLHAFAGLELVVEQAPSAGFASGRHGVEAPVHDALRPGGQGHPGPLGHVRAGGAGGRDAFVDVGAALEFADPERVRLGRAAQQIALAGKRQSVALPLAEAAEGPARMQRRAQDVHAGAPGGQVVAGRDEVAAELVGVGVGRMVGIAAADAVGQEVHVPGVVVDEEAQQVDVGDVAIERAARFQTPGGVGSDQFIQGVGAGRPLPSEHARAAGPRGDGLLRRAVAVDEPLLQFRLCQFAAEDGELRLIEQDPRVEGGMVAVAFDDRADGAVVLVGFGLRDRILGHRQGGAEAQAVPLRGVEDAVVDGEIGVDEIADDGHAMVGQQLAEMLDPVGGEAEYDVGAELRKVRHQGVFILSRRLRQRRAGRPRPPAHRAIVTSVP